MPEPLLTFFKYIFLAVLYLFFVRVLRAVWIELREPKIAVGDPRVAEPAGVAAEATVATPLNGGVAPPAAAALRLVTLAADGSRGPGFDLDGETTVGRSPGCGVALPDDTFVSQIHGRVYQRDGAVWVEDLGSTNGTWVNERRIDTATLLRAGDRLRVGQTVMELDR